MNIEKRSETFLNVELEDGRKFCVVDHENNPWLPRDRPVKIGESFKYMTPEARRIHRAFYAEWKPQHFATIEEALDYLRELES